MSLPIRPYHTILLPPPIPTSISSSISYASSPDEILRALSRQTTHLQQTLQTLLDAQSDALLAGLAPPPSSQPDFIPIAPSPAPPAPRAFFPQRYHDHPRDDASSSSSTVASRSAGTNASSSMHSPNKSPVDRSHRSQQPAARATPTVSLRAVRNAIRTTLDDLADVKARESVLLAEQIAAGAEAMAGIDALRDKKERIAAKIREMEDEAGGDEVLRAAALEEKELEREVVRMEVELFERRTRLAVVKDWRRALENRREAGLASWRGALREVEGVMEREVLMSKVKKNGWFGARKTRKNVPVDVVRDGVQGDVKALKTRREAVDREREACNQGARAWQECTQVVGTVERRLQQHIRHTIATSASSTTAVSAISSPTLRSNVPSTTAVTAAPTDTILPAFDSAINTLDNLLATAHEKEWKPLVCSIGAELAALREARSMLLETVSQTASFVTALDQRPSMLLERSMRGVGIDGDTDGGTDTQVRVLEERLGEEEGEGEKERVGEGKDEDEDEEEEQEEEEEREEEKHLTNTLSCAIEPSEDEDDEPGPELLISRLDEE